MLRDELLLAVVPLPDLASDCDDSPWEVLVPFCEPEVPSESCKFPGLLTTFELASELKEPAVMSDPTEPNVFPDMAGTATFWAADMPFFAIALDT